MATREQYNSQELFAQTLAAFLVMAGSGAAPVVTASAVAPAVPATAPAVPAAAPAALPAAAESLNHDDVKGYGKGANYGELVPPPRRLDTATASDSGTLASRRPHARGPTEDEIAEWMERFEALPATPYPIEVGSVVLWRGFKKGKKEGASTSEEFFRGEVHRIIPDDGHGKRYVYHELNCGQNAPHGE